jgi:hypothetical protein
MAGVDDALVSVHRLRDRVADFAGLLDTDPDDPEFDALRRIEWIGRPLGSMAWGRRLYVGYFNARARQTGCVFQGRSDRWRWMKIA